jgi:predicted AlkP superfamily pyrophosphatase or phosphodiesterase
MLKQNKFSLFFSFVLPLHFFSQNISIKPPKLVVGIVIDQMCYEYLYRYKSKFSENGFLRLLNNGTNCENTQYNYIPTYTGPGHASIYTGTTPDNHGIVGNDWYSRVIKKEVNCVGDSNVKSVGTKSDEGECSPKNLYVNTITDQLKLTYPKSKVISISIKDRGAILPGGHLSDGSYWFDYQTGNLITSTFYKEKLPKWVSDFNAEKQALNYLNQTWKTLLPLENYTESEQDNSKYEVLISSKKTPEFPYDFKELNKGKTNFDLFTITPFANTFLADFSIKALQNENLGLDEFTDFLAISFSTPDIAGHAFGPYSVEIEDIYLRLDLEIGKIISQLESTVGKDNFILFLTADHAVVPVPQYLTDKKLPGGYFYIGEVKKEISIHLTKKFGFNPIEEVTNNNFYLNTNLINEKKLSKTEIEDEIKTILLSKKGIKKVYTSHEISSGNTSDEWLTMVKKGYKLNESGDLIFLLEPGYLPKSNENSNSHKGTSHGSAFNYDTHVPLIWYGKGIPNQSIYRRVNITDIAATLAPLLNLQRPNSCTGEVIIEIFK